MKVTVKHSFERDVEVDVTFPVYFEDLNDAPRGFDIFYRFEASRIMTTILVDRDDGEWKFSVSEDHGWRRLAGMLGSGRNSTEAMFLQAAADLLRAAAAIRRVT